MVKIRETDYHHGAFVATLVNRGYQIRTFESFETRRSYKISKGEEEHLVYSKFSSTPSSKTKTTCTWSFTFSIEEISKIKHYSATNDHCLIVLTAHYGGSDGGELIILTYEEFLKCIGYPWNTKNARISIHKAHRKCIKVYGTGLDKRNSFAPHVASLD